MAPGPADGPVVRVRSRSPRPTPTGSPTCCSRWGSPPCRTGPRRVFRDGTGWASPCSRWRSRRPGAACRRGRAPATSLALELPVHGGRPAPPGRGRGDGGAGPAPVRGGCAAPGRRRGVRAPSWRPGRLAEPPPGRRARPSRRSTPGARPRPLPAARGAGRRLGRGGRGGRAGHLDAGDPEELTWAGDPAPAPDPGDRAPWPAGHRTGRRGLGAAGAPDDAFVLVGVGEPTQVLDRQPDCGCDACDTGSADLLSTVDDAFLLALGGGVYVVREGDRVVTRALTAGAPRACSSRGRSSGGWTDAAAGRRTDRRRRGRALALTDRPIRRSSCRRRLAGSGR